MFPFGSLANRQNKTRQVVVKKAVPAPKKQTLSANGSEKRKTSPAAKKQNGTSKPPSAARLKPSAKSTPNLRSPAPSNALSRKRTRQPDVLPALSSDSSSESEDEVVNKRLKVEIATRNSASIEPDFDRNVRDIEEWKEGEELGIIHGKQLVEANKASWKPMFDVAEGQEEELQVEMQYPSGAPPEKMLLYTPADNQDYKPLEDITSTIDTILTHYFPSSIASPHLSDSTGIRRLLLRALAHNSLPDFRAALTTYNTLIATSLSTTIPTHLTSTLRSPLPLPLVERLLTQSYDRTISPSISALSKYQNGTDNVYGELLPPFVSKILAITSLSSSSLFVDLGSGVGNVVLQAALQHGAESWGVEMMANPARLARAQLADFEGRCRMWGLKPGKVTLIEDDFLTNPSIQPILARADVVLINNKAFTAPLNDALMLKFLDLKEGARIVSLKSFVPDKWTIKESRVEDTRNVLRVTRYEYFSKSVSWTDEWGEWFVAVKDSGMLKKFLERRGRGRESRV
ncbi:DOT1-domain-containing protein [Aulographum hederae CBS 113979]|uniref:Histone-lysine N-methyltransferase, H3 lysine-79 specific n=1 Tax=Aulographum hederae CBS 113979 TaxID=1176131 RepID=A0A6G1GK23_9PEZI|nr:DOT1-domain-containing protein [Aulographum hederae CBS 113979]